MDCENLNVYPIWHKCTDVLYRCFYVIADVVDGTKSGDGSRQRSASQEQSPTRVANILHPGQSGLISIPRSSSDTNLVMDTDKKGIYVT